MDVVESTRVGIRTPLSMVCHEVGHQLKSRMQTNQDELLIVDRRSCQCRVKIAAPTTPVQHLWWCAGDERNAYWEGLH